MTRAFDWRLDFARWCAFRRDMGHTSTFVSINGHHAALGAPSPMQELVRLHDNDNEAA